MEIVFCILSFAAGGVAVFVCMLRYLALKRPTAPLSPTPQEKQYLNFLNYDGTERGQMRIDE